MLNLSYGMGQWVYSRWIHLLLEQMKWLKQSELPRKAERSALLVEETALPQLIKLV